MPHAMLVKGIDSFRISGWLNDPLPFIFSLPPPLWWVLLLLQCQLLRSSRTPCGILLHDNFRKKGLSEKGYERSPLRVGKGTRYRKQHNNVLEKRLLHLIAAEPRNVLAYYNPYYLKNSIKEITKKTELDTFDKRRFQALTALSNICQKNMQQLD